MIVDDLKKSVLNYAITGNLSSAKKDDSDIFESFQEIQNKREELFKNKVITKQQYNIINNKEDYKYPYPDYWKLTQVGCLGYVVGGGTPKTNIPEFWGDEYSWITPKDMKKFNTKYIDVGERSITQLGLDNSSAQLIPANSILCSSRAPIGYLGIAQNILTTNQGFKTLVPLGNVNSSYVYYYLMARIDDLKNSGDGTTFSEISGSDLSKFQIVLPPIEEQQRIVKRIEELFKKLDEIKPIEEELNILKKSFSNNMKSSLFQSAISGKLTIQNNTENVNSVIDKLKSQKDIPINKIPFKIPDNWKWIRFGDLVEFNIGKTPPRADLSYWGKKGYNWVSISDMVDGELIKNTKEYVSEKAYNDLYHGNISKKGTLIMSFKLTVGRCSILDIDSFHNEGIISIYPKYDSNIIKQYLFKILPYITKFGDVKGAIKGNTLNSKSLNDLPIPLPPIEEQERIIKKLEQLLPLCDDIDNLVNS